MTGPCGNKNCPHDLYNEQFGDNCGGHFSFGMGEAKHLAVPMICKDFKPCEPTLEPCPICGEMPKLKTEQAGRNCPIVYSYRCMGYLGAGDSHDHAYIGSMPTSLGVEEAGEAWSALCRAIRG